MYLLLMVILQLPILQGRSNLIINVSCQIESSHDAVQSLLILQNLACPKTSREISH